MKSELLSISEDIDLKLSRIKFLDDSNPFENKEILKLRAEIEDSINYLRLSAKKNQIHLSGLRLA